MRPGRSLVYLSAGANVNDLLNVGLDAFILRAWALKELAKKGKGF